MATPPDKGKRAMLAAIGLAALVGVPVSAIPAVLEGGAQIDPLQVRAHLGDREAMIALGRVLWVRGDGDSRRKAEEWTRRAAEAGSAIAMYDIARRRLNPEVNEPRADTSFSFSATDEESVKWLAAAADKGHPPAMRDFAMVLEAGWGCRRDTNRAAVWFRRAAEAGDVDSMFRVGWTYAHGTWGAVDAEKALEWLKRAAHAGHLESMLTLGRWFASGNRGMFPCDREEALYWFSRAAAVGDTTAKRSIAELSRETE